MSGSRFFGKKKEVEVKPKAETIDEEQSLNAMLSDAIDESAVPEVQAKVEEPVNQPVKSSTPIVHKAYNTFLDKSLGKYMLATIEYDPVAKTAKVVSVDPFTDELTVALHKLQGLFALKVFRNEESV